MSTIESEINFQQPEVLTQFDEAFESQFSKPPVWIKHEAGSVRFRLTSPPSPPEGPNVSILIMPGFGESSVHLKGLHQEYWKQGWTTASLHHKVNHRKQNSVEGDSPYQEARADTVIEVAEYLHRQSDDHTMLIDQARSEGGVIVPLAADKHPELFDAIILDHSAATHGYRVFPDIPSSDRVA